MRLCCFLKNSSFINAPSSNIRNAAQNMLFGGIPTELYQLTNLSIVYDDHPCLLSPLGAKNISWDRVGCWAPINSMDQFQMKLGIFSN